MTPTILIMAGGTGGHIFPALAVADWLKSHGWRVVWLGSANAMEARLIPQRGYEIEYVNFSGVRGKGLLRLALLPFGLLIAFWQAARIIRKLKPDVVLGVGGYVTFPGGMMASLLNRPLVIHEQNSIAGLANRVLALIADRVLLAFPGAFDVDPDKPRSLASFIPQPTAFEVVGNPVRSDIAALPEPEQRYADRDDNLRLLVVGGSLGAQILNSIVPRALQLLEPARRPRVTHQAGDKHIDTLRTHYNEAGVSARLQSFIDDMAAAYGECDLILCRAGALTVAEICAAGVASILVPYPHAVDDHQTGNARFLSDAGAAVLLPQAELTPQSLATLLMNFTREKLLAMAQKARSLAMPLATESVARACIALGTRA